MSTDIEALRASMRAAQVYGKGQYFNEAGRYLLEVQKLFYKRTLIDGTAKENIICEFTVLESSNPTVEVGSTRSSVFSFNHQGWLSRFKSLVLALLGADADSKVFSQQAEDAATDIYVALRSDDERIKLKLPENFMAGKRVRAEAIPGTSKKGGAVTNMRWTPVAQ